DIFPSNLIANILVSKNFTANMPADFTGGLLNIELKDFPDKKIVNVSVKASYNPDMHFNPDYPTYQGGATDFLGFDGGMRALPAGAGSSVIPTPISGNSPDEVNSFINSFNPTLNATRKMSPLDFSASISMGNQIDLNRNNGGPENNRKLGYIFSLSYKSDFKYYDDVIFGEYQRYIDPDKYEMRYATISEGDLGKKNFLVGLLGGIAYKTNYSKIRFTLMHLQNGESTAGIMNIDNDGAAVGQSGYLATSHNLEYNQRSITNIFLNGSRKYGSSGWDLDWRIAPTLSLSKDPDIRKTAFTREYDGPTFSAGAGGNPSRIWRNLSEYNVPARIDMTKAYALNDMDGKISFGASQTYKYRSYQILSFDIQFFGQQPNWTDYDPSLVLVSENIFPNGKIYYQSGNSNQNPNAYTSNVSNSAAYVSNELELFGSLKTILGLRAEYYVQRHTGRDITYASGDVTNGLNLENEKVLESLDLFPSINMILSLTDAQNLRAAYSRTIARPSFKELSFAQIIDPITNRIFNGSLFTYSGWDGNLAETRIDNKDLRWEYFMAGGQMLSISGFMKNFDNPIELVRIPEQQTSTEYQPRNVGDGRLVGVEFEIRKNFSFLSSYLRDFSFSSNITLVESQITMTDVEYNSRETYLKSGETLSRTRSMAGQSPYVINSSLTYTNYDLGLDAGIFYNVKGPTLYIVGGDCFPTYTMILSIA
ncbi:MAG: TonB-dependent receptor, partial [Cyclobacteriaceae bacterium]|nr:TonB-dependent receptor [Cyclobacteriaceae bacterium]